MPVSAHAMVPMEMPVPVGSYPVLPAGGLDWNALGGDLSKAIGNAVGGVGSFLDSAVHPDQSKARTAPDANNISPTDGDHDETKYSTDTSVDTEASVREGLDPILLPAKGEIDAVEKKQVIGAHFLHDDFADPALYLKDRDGEERPYYKLWDDILERLEELPQGSMSDPADFLRLRKKAWRDAVLTNPDGTIDGVIRHENEKIPLTLSLDQLAHGTKVYRSIERWRNTLNKLPEFRNNQVTTEELELIKDPILAITSNGQQMDLVLNHMKQIGPPEMSEVDKLRAIHNSFELNTQLSKRDAQQMIAYYETQSSKKNSKQSMLGDQSSGETFNIVKGIHSIAKALNLFGGKPDGYQSKMENILNNATKATLARRLVIESPMDSKGNYQSMMQLSELPRLLVASVDRLLRLYPEEEAEPSAWREDLLVLALSAVGNPGSPEARRLRDMVKSGTRSGEGHYVALDLSKGPQGIPLAQAAANLFTLHNDLYIARFITDNPSSQTRLLKHIAKFASENNYGVYANGVNLEQYGFKRTHNQEHPYLLDGEALEAFAKSEAY